MVEREVRLDTFAKETQEKEESDKMSTEKKIWAYGFVAGVLVVIAVIIIGALMSGCAPATPTDAVYQSSGNYNVIKPVEFNFSDVGVTCFVQPQINQMECLVTK